MSLYDELVRREEKLAVIGLGYVGLPIAAAFAEKLDVIGFDQSKEKVALYQKGVDPTGEIGDEKLRDVQMDFTTDERKLQDARFHIVAVPTPVNHDKTPDLFPIENAARMVGRNLKRGSIVVFESTVYPGVTEQVCIPILEEESGLQCGLDFKVGYSPERINPGDRVHTLATIRKIVSGSDPDALREIRQIYDLVVQAGTYPVSDIKTAEAIKVAENSQRDINIAFMNELAMVFDRMGIDTNEVIDGMNTKWNALGFRPGLVGGHCIGVDPYYFVYEAEQLGYHSQIILSGRRVNDGMAEFIAQAAVRQMILSGLVIKGARVLILGVTFKENCPDIRNSKVADMIGNLKSFGVETVVSDPWADRGAAMKEYGITLKDQKDISEVDCVILAVAHRQYLELSLDDLDAFFRPHREMSKRVLVDIKGILNPHEVKTRGFCYWRL